MTMDALYCGILVTLLLALVGVGEARSRAKAKDFPACYYDSVAYSNNYVACSNPLYQKCGQYLCCGPDHECCTHGTVPDRACCRIHKWSPYELTGVFAGLFAWVGNLAVIVTCVTPQIARKIKRQFFRSSKVMPKD